MKIYLGSDHAAFELKETIKKFLKKKKIEFEDLGTHSLESCDYPDYAHAVAKKVAKEKDSLGILICGTGIGMSMAANKHKGIRSAVAWNEETAKLSREHNDANILCLGSRQLSKDLALKIVDIWLKTPFSDEERHKKRVAKID